MFSLDHFFRQHHRRTVYWVLTHALSTGLTPIGSLLEERAEEAVQDAWAALAARDNERDEPGTALLMTIALRSFWRAWTRDAKSYHREDGYAHETERFVESSVPQAARAPEDPAIVPVVHLGAGATATAEVAYAASILPDQKFEVWALRHAFGLSYAQIAQEMGLSSPHMAIKIISKAHLLLAGETIS